MRVINASSPRELADCAADWTAARLASTPEATLALPTGQTPVGLYAELVRRARGGSVRLDGARLFNLDEYVGLPASDPHSYAAFMEEHLIRPAGMRPAQVRLLRGDAPDVTAECLAYDADIAQRGGIDVCILGLGANGHIAFNEPGSAWHLRTHVVELSHSTRQTHEAQTGQSWDIPSHGITMGIQTLLEAKHVMLLIAGANKRSARDALHRGSARIEWPVTALADHPELTVIELS